MYRNIWRKYGKILDTDADLLHTVREAGIGEQEFARALSGKKLITRPQKEKETVADQKGNTGQMAEKPREKFRAPVRVTGGVGPDKWDKFLDQELLCGGFKEAIKEVPEEELEEYRKKDTDCQRCRLDGHKTRACFAQTTAKGIKLSPPPKMPSLKASAILTK